MTIKGSIAEKLRELYPSGLILGDSQVIVGKYGLTINWFNRDLTKGEKKYIENETLSITEIDGEILTLSEPFSGVRVHSKLFKGFKKRK